jgi:hypothetical protein
MYLQLRIFNPEYSTERICAAVLDMPIFACIIYCKFCAKYRDHPQVFAIWTVVPDIYNASTAPHIQASMFIWTYLRCYWRYLDNSMLVILQTWGQIQRTSSGLRYVNCGPGHIQCIYSSIYSEFNIHLNVSALILFISRPVKARYTPNLLPNTAHIPQYMLCELWSSLYTKYFQLRIFRLKYSTVVICAAIVHITAIQCAIYCILGDKYSAHPPVYAMRPVVPAIYKVFSAPHI